MHLVVRADSGIESIEQLAGKKVNFSDIGSGTQLSTRDVFDRLKIKAEEVNMGQAMRSNGSSPGRSQQPS